ncbi:MAG: ATP-grasp peptide maturase system methyltransferase [Pseudonocardiaceae bacterium]
MADHVTLRKQLAERLTADGSLRSSQWRSAFEIVPRHLFVPRFFSRTDDGMRHVAVDYSDPEWLKLVYQDQAWTTQLNGDERMWEIARREGPVEGVPTSSSSQPSLMAAMLESLNVEDGHRVLEIGTGTGYNAALLCQRLGDSHVVSLDIDPILVARATNCLARAGYRPTVVATDGMLAHVPGPRFERLIATVAVSFVPPVWLTQVRSGGLILVNLNSDLSGGPLVRLTVNDNRSASGYFDPTPALFMPTRSYPPSGSLALFKATLNDPQPATVGRSDLDQAVLNDREFLFFASLRLRDVSRMGLVPTDGELQEWLVARDGSWAYRTSSGATGQAGRRKLWDELEAIANQWRQFGQPTRTRFGLTVTNKHRLWLDSPESPQTWTLDDPGQKIFNKETASS